MPGKRADNLIGARVWVDRELWNAALAKAASQGRPLSEVIREFLKEYTGRKKDI